MTNQLSTAKPSEQVLGCDYLRLPPDFDTRPGGQLVSTQEFDKQWIDELR